LYALLVNFCALLSVRRVETHDNCALEGELGFESAGVAGCGEAAPDFANVHGVQVFRTAGFVGESSPDMAGVFEFRFCCCSSISVRWQTQRQNRRPEASGTKGASNGETAGRMPALPGNDSATKPRIGDRGFR
jgi:hypothetical protein